MSSRDLVEVARHLGSPGRDLLSLPAHSQQGKMGHMPERSEPIHPAYEPVYEVVKVVRLPVPNEIRAPDCMIGPKVWLRRRIRRLASSLVPRQTPRTCCWHHQVDWHQAAAAAIRLVVPGPGRRRARRGHQRLRHRPS